MPSRRSVHLPLQRGSAIYRSRSMHDGALDAIGMAIVRGHYPIGSLLPSKDELMERLDVSHTTLREAMQTLTAKGMVAARAKVGTRVLEETHWNMFDADILAWRLEKGIEPSFLASLFEMRQTFEPAAAALAAVRASDDDIARLRDLAQDLEEAPNNKEAFVAADVAFHQLIVEMSANPFMQSLGALINTALAASFTLSAPTAHPELLSLVRRQHLDIVDAIAAHDAQRASDTMMTVIRQGWKNYSDAGTRLVTTLDVLSFLDQ